MQNEHKLNDGDLFDNPMVTAARAAMTKEQIESYERMGKEMYATEFSDAKPDVIDQIADTIAHIKEAVKSGLHPRYLEPAERELVTKLYGKFWLVEYGYSKKDAKQWSK